MSTITRRVGDRNPLQAALREDDGSAVNLSGATVVLRATNVASGATSINDAACTVDDAAQGFVSYAFGAGDTVAANAGVHRLSFLVTIGGIPRTFPVRESMKLVILPRASPP